MKVIWAILAVLAIATLYLGFAPTRVMPVAWSAPTAPGFKDGPFRSNECLRAIEKIARTGARGPESVAVDGQGRVIAGYVDGRILRFTPDGTHEEVLTDTGGRPLGVKLHPDGSLYVADAKKGLIRVTAEGHSQVLVSAVDGVPLGFSDDLSIDHAGRTVYFSDASSKFGWGYDRDDVLEHGGHGRLLSYDVASGHARCLLNDLQFANGVALGPDDSYVLVNETGAYRITRFWLKGPRAGTHDTFVDNLPGFPDNITFNGRDRFWVALFAQRDAIVDALAPHPAIRRSVARLLALVPAPIPAHAIALAYDIDGHLIANLQASGGDSYFPVTSVLEAGPWLYFGSLTQEPIGRMPLETALRDTAD